MELANPATRLPRIENTLEYRTYQGSLPGSAEGTSWIYEFTPVYPIELDNGRIVVAAFNSCNRRASSRRRA